MDWFEVVFLSLVQGLTEFLPISSSGHLVIFQKFFGFSKPPVLFDILLHIGTFWAVVFYFRQELARIFRGVVRREKKSFNALWLIIIGTIPATLVGVLFENQIELAFDSLKAVGFFFLFTAVLLFSIKLIKKADKQFDQLSWKNAFLIGLFQAIAILPGVSRSGSTIVAGLWQGATRETAFRFSFYLAIPAILGALILKSGELLISSTNDLVQGFVGMVTAGLIGYFALRILEKVLKSAKFWGFGIYCLVLGLMLLFLG